VVQQTEGLIAPPMCWQPNGRHLFTCREYNSVTDRVLLFERNGLAHGGFDLCPGSGDHAWSQMAFYFMDVLFPRISLELIITIQLTIQPNVLTWAPLQSQVQYVKCVGAQTQSYLPSYWPRIRMIKNLGAHFR